MGWVELADLVVSLFARRYHLLRTVILVRDSMATYRSLFAAGLILFTACQSKPDSSTLRLKLLVETQRRANDQLLKADENMLKGIGYAVESGRYQPKEVAVFERAEAVLKRTKALVSRLRSTQFAISRHFEQERDILALNEREPVASVISNSRSATSADSLFHNLASFVEFVKPLTSQPIEALWLVEGGTNPTSASQIFATPESYRKFYFEDATVIEALAVLSQQEAELLRLTGSVLGNQGRLVGGSVSFYRIYAYAVAESNTVYEGERYKADLLLVRETGGEKALRMTANGKNIFVGKDGRGRVEFPVVQQLPPGQNTKRAFWDGTIIVRTYGHDSTFRVRVPYTIRK